MKRILIVEDDVSLCLQLSDLLYEFGFDTAVASDGIQALEILNKYTPLPDLILLDLHMPNMNGWELREKLQQDEKFKKISVVIMSGDQAAVDVPAEHHLMKPLDIYALRAILQ
jgi:CheY-like chemotaxis protein